MTTEKKFLLIKELLEISKRDLENEQYASAFNNQEYAINELKMLVELEDNATAAYELGLLYEYKHENQLAKDYYFFVLKHSSDNKDIRGKAANNLALLLKEEVDNHPISDMEKIELYKPVVSLLYEAAINCKNFDACSNLIAIDSYLEKYKLYGIHHDIILKDIIKNYPFKNLNVLTEFKKGPINKRTISFADSAIDKEETLATINNTDKSEKNSEQESTHTQPNKTEHSRLNDARKLFFWLSPEQEKVSQHPEPDFNLTDTQAFPGLNENKGK